MTTDLRASAPNSSGAAATPRRCCETFGRRGRSRSRGRLTAINPCAERLLESRRRRRSAATTAVRSRRRSPVRSTTCSHSRRARARPAPDQARRSRAAETELMMTASPLGDECPDELRHGAVLRGRQPDRQGRADGGVARGRAPHRARDQESADADPAFGRAPAAPARRAPRNRITPARGMHPHHHRRSRGSQASGQ